MPQYVEKSASRYILVTLAVVLFVTAMVLVILQNTSFRNIGLGVLKTYSDGYADGFNKARELATQAGLPNMSTHQVLSGTVTDVGSDNVTFTVSGLVMDERVDGVGLARAAYTTTGTVIVLLTLRPDNEMLKLREDFSARISAMKPGDVPPAPPSFYAEKKIALSEVLEGDNVTAVSSNNEDVTNAESFYASRLEIRRLAQ